MLVLDSVRKFLQFQLAVNLVAIVLTFMGSVIKGEAPLTTIQLLWVNLIMDTLGALALASDDPGESVLNQPPHSRKASLLSTEMRQHILIQFLYQFGVLFGIHQGLDTLLPKDPFMIATSTDNYADLRTPTVVFCTFIFLQLSNLILSRQLSNELWPFGRIITNRVSVGVILSIITVQLVIAIFGRGFVHTCLLTMNEWYVVIVVAFVNFPVTVFARIFFRMYNHHMAKKKKAKTDAATFSSPDLKAGYQMEAGEASGAGGGGEKQQQQPPASKTLSVAMVHDEDDVDRL
jgi:Ca2+-transporting ATPase